MAILRTLAIIKPGFVFKERVIGKILDMFERSNLRIVGAKFIRITQKQFNELYASFINKPFFSELSNLMMSLPVFVFCLESTDGVDAVKKTRKIIGETNPINSNPGTIRRMYGEDISRNCIHASSSEEEAEKEIKIFFNLCELF